MVVKEILSVGKDFRRIANPVRNWRKDLRPRSFNDVHTNRGRARSHPRQVGPTKVPDWHCRGIPRKTCRVSCAMKGRFELAPRQKFARQMKDMRDAKFLLTT